MTYREKYNELFIAYEKAVKSLFEATKAISFANGFGDTNELHKYLKAHGEHRFVEREFRQLLKYVTSKNLNPESEYIQGEFMYNYIKDDQRRKGVSWDDHDLIPNAKGGIKGFECLIGLTNDGEINGAAQSTEYKFPVVNLEHGKECYTYLTQMLQNGGGEGFDVNNLKFVNIDGGKQIYIKVMITIWQ
jgi:hypothetical protein